MAFLLFGSALVFLSGCADTRYQQANLHRPPAPPAAVVAPATNQSAREAATKELGAEAADAIPPTTRPAAPPPEPVAKAVVESMVNAMNDRAVGPDGMTHIGMTQLRNQSRSGPVEFTEFVNRFAQLLNNAAAGGREWHVQFDPANMDVQYQLQGAAYLIPVEGFDTWELYISLSRIDPVFSIWESHGPIHVLRQPRAGQVQILGR